MGVIWSARHRVQGIEAAVKVLTQGRAKDRAFRSAFRKEVRAVAGLDHPNIVMVFDHGEVPQEAERLADGQILSGTPYLAMELVPGGSLTSRRGHMKWPDLRDVLLDLLGALAHAHSRGVIHRDIKPGNVLVRNDGTVKLTDFGLAHATEVGGHRAEAARRGGTPAYMAPEQLQGEWRDYGPWTDLYAVGCLSWSMATGKPPFHKGSWLDVMQAHLSREAPAFEPRHAMPAGFEGWLRHLLAKNPHRRFRRAADAAWALLALTDPVETYTPPVSDDAEPQLPAHTLDGLRAARTTLFWSDGELPSTVEEMLSTPLPAERGRRFDRPPLPLSAHRAKSGHSNMLAGAGLGLYGLRSIAMVGRRQEQDLLWKSLAAVHNRKERTLVSIAGPVGCGKSRLAQWLCQRAHEVGAATVLKASHAQVLGPGDGLARMVASHLRCVGLERDDVKKRMMNVLLSQGVEDEYEWLALTELIAPSSESDSLRLGSPRQRYILMQRLVERLCEERPVIIWLDDVQWGPDALGFARHLLELRDDLPVMLLLTSRDAETTTGRLKKLVERPETTRIDLDHLSPRDASQLVRGLLGLEGELADRVEARVAGNPLFAVQLVGDWVNRGLLEPTDRGFRLKAGVRADLPDDLHQVWSDAIAPILQENPAGALITLELAAALGQNVDAVEWKAVCEQARVPHPAHLTESLSRARLMRSSSSGWTFVHAMLRESLERTARDSGRWRNHNRGCYNTLRSLYPETNNTIAGRMGRHLLEAGALSEALDLLLVGARRQGEASEYRAALELLDLRDNALDEMGLPGTDLNRITGWLLRGRIYLAQGRPHLAHAWAERASAAANSQDQPELKAEAYSRLGQVAQARGELDLAERRLLAALKLFRDKKLWEGVGDCLHGLGKIADSRGRYARARELFEQARGAYAAVNAPLALAQCIDGMSQAARKMGDLERARSLNEEAMARFQGLGNLTGVATSKRRLARLALLRWDYAGSDRLTLEALRLFEHTGDLSGQQNCINGLAESARFRGDLQEAEAGYRRALEIGQSIGTGDQILQRANLTLVVLARGRYPEARSMFENMCKEVEQSGRRALLGGCHLGLTACAAAMNDLPSTELHFRLARALLEETGAVDPDNAQSAETAANLLWEHHHAQWARALWELALHQWEGLGRTEDAERVLTVLREHYRG